MQSQEMEQNKKLLIPKIDVVFHSLFRIHKEKLTSNFVSSLIQNKVKVINIDKDRHLLKRYPEEKLGILDLKTELEGGILCNIEIQLANKNDIIDRILYYWSRAFNEQLKEGDEYGKLHKTIIVLITDFELKEMEKIEELGKRWVIMLDSEEKRILTDKLEIRILEIPKARRLIKRNEKDEIAQWLMFLDNPNSMEVSKIMSENEEIKEAVEDLEELSKDYELRRLAELKEKYIRDKKAEDAYCREQGLEQGLKQGLKQGLEQGLEQGLKKGMKKGREEGTKATKREIVKKLLEEKVEIDFIVRVTGLTEEEIKEIE